ncbi:hypothetical protein PRIPAC_86348 [Pristionchus pacificus]|nr:hypothetical protein PRIPAC_86348 [Pristionchus pacificus]
MMLLLNLYLPILVTIRYLVISLEEVKMGDVHSTLLHHEDWELLRIEMRVSHSRKRESLVRGASLFQPDTIVKIVRQKDNSQSRMVLSTYGLTMDVHEIDRMGTVRFKKELGCRALNNDPLFISSFDTYYTHSTNTLYIFAGSSTGELMMHIWDMNMDNHSFKSERLEKTIGEVFFFGNEHPKDPPVLVVYVNDSSIKVCGYNHKTQVFLNMYRIPFSTDGDKQRRDFIDNRVHVMCNGDDTTIHDIWIINKSSATLHSGRRFNFGKKKLKVSLKSVKGRVESIFILSTRKNGASDLYADFVFVAKANSRIAVLSTIQTFGELPDSIHFAELNFNDSDSKSSALYGEIIDYSSREQNQIDATIRFFIARSKEIVITLVKLSINTESLNVVEIVTLGKIHTNIMDPSHFVVSRMEKIPDRTTPMYGIISGFEGTQIVRICDKKLQPSLTENGKIEMI